MEPWVAGRHLIIDFYNCQNHGNMDKIEAVMIRACENTGATVLYSYIHPFEGGGVSGAVILAESHMSIHTWPERSYISLDIYVCGTCDPLKALSTLREHFQPENENLMLIERGLDPTVTYVT